MRSKVKGHIFIIVVWSIVDFFLDGQTSIIIEEKLIKLA